MILSRPTPLHFILLSALTATACLSQQAPHKNRDLGYDDTPLIPGQKWRVHDNTRKHPPKVTAAAQPGGAPSDAIVLFDGKDLSQWVARLRGGKEGPAEWKVENGYMEVVPGKGGIATKEKFGDAQIHVEWQELPDVSGTSQSRGNGGVEIMGRYEIQVLDSLPGSDLRRRPGRLDLLASGLHGERDPQGRRMECLRHRVCGAPTKFDGEKLVKPAYITLFHNGVLMHNRQEVIGRAIHAKVATYAPRMGPEEPLWLQKPRQCRAVPEHLGTAFKGLRSAVSRAAAAPQSGQQERQSDQKGDCTGSGTAETSPVCKVSLVMARTLADVRDGAERTAAEGDLVQAIQRTIGLDEVVGWRGVEKPSAPGRPG
ncbi:MAG: DUF1080 domain-containing protein [Paludibaculum sp.]